MKTVFSLRDIEVRLGQSFCLSAPHLDLDISRIHVVTGPNGAGKSTLLRTLALLIPAQKGAIYFSGQRIETVSKQLVAIRRKLTLVEQSPYLLQGTVFSNLAFGLKIRRTARAEQQQRIGRALEDVGLSGFAQRKVRDLSGGESQRVALARALVLKPEVLLLDEPMANIDYGSLPGFDQLLRSLSAAGVTIILSTHDPRQTERLGGVLIRVEKGKVFPRN